MPHFTISSRHVAHFLAQKGTEIKPFACSESQISLALLCGSVLSRFLSVSRANSHTDRKTAMNFELTWIPGRSITVQSKAKALRFLPRSPLGKFFFVQASYLPTFTAPFAHLLASKVLAIKRTMLRALRMRRARFSS